MNFIPFLCIAVMGYLFLSPVPCAFAIDVSDFPAGFETAIPISKPQSVPLNIDDFDEAGLVYQWERATQAGEQAFSRGAAGDSERHYRAALAAAEKLADGDLKEAMVLHRLGLLMVFQQKPEEGRVFLEKALKLRLNDIHTPSIELSESFQDTGSLYHTLGLYKEGEAYLKRAVELRKSAKTKNDRKNLAASWISLGGILWEQGRNDEGDRSLQTGMSILLSVLGESIFEYGMILRNISRTYLRFNRVPEAIRYMKDSIALLETLRGKNAPVLGGLLEDFALIRKKQKRLDDALSLLQRSLKISTEAFGPESPVVYRTKLTNLDVLIDYGKNEQALKVLNEAILMAQNLYGTSHSNVKGLSKKYAFLLHQGEAGNITSRVICTPQVVNLLSDWKNKGSSAMKAGNDSLADKYMSRAVEVFQKLKGLDDPIFFTREAKATVIVRSGHTVVIGGLIRQENKETSKKVPILGDLPFIKHAFRYKEKGIEKTELIAFLTPVVIGDDGKAEAMREIMWNDFKGKIKTKVFKKDVDRLYNRVTKATMLDDPEFRASVLSQAEGFDKDTGNGDTYYKKI